MTTTTRTTTADTATSRSVRRTRAVAVLGAAAAATAGWVVADPIVGMALAAQVGADAGIQEIGAGSVVVMTVLAGLAGWGTLALLERFTRRPRTIWLAVAIAVMVVSLAGPLGGGVTGGAKLVLAGLHLLAGAVLIPVLARSTADRS